MLLRGSRLLRSAPATAPRRAPLLEHGRGRALALPLSASLPLSQFTSPSHQVWLPHTRSFHNTIPTRNLSTGSDTKLSAGLPPSNVLDTAAAAPGTSSFTDAATYVITKVFNAMASVFDPISRFVSPHLQDLPYYFHLESNPHGYAISLVLLAFLLRASVSLPMHLWMRARMARLTEKAFPEWERVQRDEEFHKGVVRRCRKQGLSHERYKKELERELLSIRASLLRKYRCRIGPTKWLPPLVNIPIFLAVSFAIRHSLLTPDSPWFTEILPWWSPPEHLAKAFDNSAAMLRDRGMDPEALQKLSKPMGPTLGDKDATNVAPLAVGLLTFLNIELASKGGEKVRALMKLGSSNNQPESSIPMEKIKSDEEVAEEQKKTQGGIKKWAYIGRGLAIGSVPIATQVPGAILIYWLSSIIYTLIQTTTFNYLDLRRARSRVLQRANESSNQSVASSPAKETISVSFAEARRGTGSNVGMKASAPGKPPGVEAAVIEEQQSEEPRSPPQAVRPEGPVRPTRRR